VMGHIIGVPDIRKVANDASDRLRRVLDKLGG